MVRKIRKRSQSRVATCLVVLYFRRSPPERRLFVKRLVLVILLLCVAVPTFAKTHKDVFNVPCSVLWPAVKDTLRNSGKYGIIGIDNTEMTASYNIGGTLGGKRTNSLVLNSKENNCEMQLQTAYSGLEHNDAGDLKKRVDESLAKLQAAQGSPSTNATGQPAAEGSATQAPPPARPTPPNK